MKFEDCQICYFKGGVPSLITNGKTDGREYGKTNMLSLPTYD